MEYRVERKIIVVGDSPACGGEVLPFEAHPPSYIMGHRIALIGGRVFCAGCNSVGHIAKAGGPYRMGFCDAEQALEGDVVVCACPVPQPLVSSKQNISSCEDRGGAAGVFSIASMGADWYCPSPAALMSSKEIVDGFVRYPVATDPVDRICPDIGDDAFIDLMLKLRDRAVYLTRRKIVQLESWDRSARTSVALWFGFQDESIRWYLHEGLSGCVAIMERFGRGSFARYSEALVHELGCVSNGKTADAAAVCRTDVKTHTLMFKPSFCILRPDSGRFDSKVATLIHEASHFEDAFSAVDLHYGFDLSLRLAKSDPAEACRNADNFAGYVVWETDFNS